MILKYLNNMKFIIDLLSVIAFITGVLFFIIGTLLFAYSVNVYLGLSLSGIYLAFFNYKIFNNYKV